MSIAKSPIVVVGAGIAGVSAAEAARETAPDVPVVLLSKERTLPCYRLRLIEYIGGEPRPEALQLHPSGWYEERGIDLLLDRTVQRIVPVEKRLDLSDGSSLEYSALVLATGSVPFLPPVEGAHLPGVHTLWTFADVIAIDGELPGIRSAVVVGGGLLGLESAYRLCQQGIQVTVVEMVPRLLPNQLDPEGSRIFEAKVRSLGIEVRTGASVSSLAGDGRVRAVQFKDDTFLPADLVLFAVGVRPALDCLEGSGVSVGKRIAVDDAMRTNIDGVFAAGDAAEVGGRWYGLWTAAKAQGRVAGINAAGGDERLSLDVAPYFLNTMGTRVVSIGAIGDECQDVESLVREDEEALLYKKLVFQADRIAGAILVGDASLFQKLNLAVRNGMYKEEALQAGFLEA